jgi:hypothetical protein
MTEVTRRDSVSFFSTDMRKIIKLYRRGDQILLKVEPVVDGPYYVAGMKIPTAVFEAFAKINAKNAENPGEVKFSAEVLSHPEFLKFIGAGAP